MAEFSLSSSAFAPGGTIPRRHTCDGEDHSPPLSWSALPAGTRSLALVLDDPDAPSGRFIHWLAWGITPGAGALADGKAAPLEGRNDFGTVGYRGHARRAGMAATATASASTRWPTTSGLRPAPGCGSWSTPWRARSWPSPNSSGPTNADPAPPQSRSATWQADRAEQSGAPSADRSCRRGRVSEVVAPPRVPSGMVVSRRSGRSRAPGSAGPPDGRVACRSHRLLPARPTKPSQDTPRNLPVWPGAPGVCWPTRTACHRGGPWSGAVGPELCEPTGRGRRNHDLIPPEPSEWPPCRRVHRQPAPASRSAVARPDPSRAAREKHRLPDAHSVLPFVPASCPSSARRRDQPEHRVPRCLSRELLVRGRERHVEIRAGDRHLPEVLPKDRDAVFGPHRLDPEGLGRRPWRS
jgi:Phosphatidylethanolamine-binding protein